MFLAEYPTFRQTVEPLSLVLSGWLRVMFNKGVSEERVPSGLILQAGPILQS